MSLAGKPKPDSRKSLRLRRYSPTPAVCDMRLFFWLLAFDPFDGPVGSASWPHWGRAEPPGRGAGARGKVVPPPGSDEGQGIAEEGNPLKVVQGVTERRR